ncbi:two-component regulator propeller domain-containing protein [Horticoccus sp. 23ND18S-11]|uniref:two-component regulator propeller domain-containing protein n=1 Tax=Horticoccus sp. 23ND18S-11 TaxID=3391832 RepID=UPI0039C8CDAA
MSLTLRWSLLTIVALLAIARAPGRPLPVPFQSEYHAEIWGLEEGFPENSCSGIVTSPEGYLWLGTFRGLVRFNGSEFKPWAPAAMPGLSSIVIINMYRDSRGRVWFSTAEGLVMNDGPVWKKWRADEGWDDAGDYVRSYAEDANGNLVLTRFGGRVYRLDQDVFRPLPTPPGAGGSLCAYDRSNQLYVVRSGFVGRLVDREWVPIEPDSTLASRVLGTGQDRAGNAVVICTDEVLRLQDGAVTSRVRLSRRVGIFWRLTEDASGALWLPSVDAGAYRIQPDGTVKQFLKADGLPHSGGTRVVHVDGHGSIWIGSGVGGFSRFRPVRFRHVGEKEGIGDRETTTLAPLKSGDVLLSASGDGLWTFDGGTAVKRVELRDAPTAYFRSVLQTQDERTWVGTFGQGLRQLEGDTLTPAAVEIFGRTETITSLFEDSRQRLWVGGDHRVAFRSGDTFTAVDLGTEAGPWRPTLFAERREGTVLLARRHVIFGYGPTGLAAEPVVRLPADWRVSTLVVDTRDRIWIGTSGHGLAVFDGGRLFRFDPERGLPGTSIAALTQDRQGHLWFGAGRKIVRADPDELRSAAEDRRVQPELKVFDQDDGLRELDFPTGTQPTVARDAAGRLWFALIRGAAMVDPATITLNDLPPKVMVESISFVPDGARQPIEIALSETSPAPVLPAGSRMIRISYAAFDFIAPRKQHFRVRLGDAEDWQDMERENVVSFLELPAGRHTLQIQAAGSDGVWNLAGAKLTFEIAPFYWQTGWFRGLVAFGLVGLVGSAAWFAAESRTRVARDKLERERRLASAQVRLGLVLENTSDFVAFTDAEESLVYVNRAGRSLIGLPTAADVRATSMATVLPEWAREQLTRVALPAAMRDGTWSGESALLHRDGHEIPVSQVILAHRAPDGRLDFTSMIARDISAAKRHSMVQDALRGLAASLTAALEPRSLGATVAAACRTLFSHDAFFLVLLDPRGAVTFGAYMEDTAEGDNRPREVPSNIHTLSAQMRPVLQGTPLLVNRDGPQDQSFADAFEPWGNERRRSRSMMHAPVLWETRVIGIVSVQSYTVHRYQPPDLQQLQTLADHCGAAIARMNVEASLRKNEERLRLAMQTARMGSWEIDVDTRSVLASPEAEDVYGYLRGALSGPVENLAARAAEPAATELRYRLNALLDGRAPDLDYTHRLILPDGRERWLELKGHRQQRADATAPLRIIGVTADITSRRLAELERAKLEEQLRQSQKLEAIGTLAGGIAHDFNNILTAILGNVELALVESDPDKLTRDSLEKIKLSGQRARDLVRRILAFSQPHENKRQLTAPRLVVEEVVKLLRSTIPAGVELTITSAADLPLVEIDSTELHQMLLNLGTNAWQAIESAQGRITFALDVRTMASGRSDTPPELKPGRYVRLAVSDTGKGIPAAVMPRIFDPFFTTKPPGEGTGLGLSVVHGILRANGGAIKVTSTVGAGSLFELYFPASTATAPSAPVPVRPPAAPPQVGKGERILFVDDEEALVLVADRVFSRAGYAITTCMRPRQALALFRDDPLAFQLVVSDLSMPEMSGLDLAGELLRIRPTLPVILTSGYLRRGEAAAARKVGVREIVEKPNTPQDLLPIIARLLKTASNAGSVPPVDSSLAG